ncbi:MAG: hypothetical protein AB1767_12090 [Bacillota bacterium]
MKLDFVRGHMGGNIIILLHGGQFTPGRELEQAVKILGSNYLAGHEAGLLYPPTNGANLAVKIAEPTSNCYISACGGLTQVLGKALLETSLGRDYGIPLQEPLTEILLETGAGLVKIAVDTAAGRALRVVTNLQAFAGESYAKGVGAMELQGIPVVRAGKFLAVNGDLVKQKYPRADFRGWDAETRSLLAGLQEEFMRRTGESEYNYVLYDWRPEFSGDLRVVYPHCIPQDFFEPSCGTGSVAAGIALLASGELCRQKEFTRGSISLKLEAGGGIELGGPDITELKMTVEDGKLIDVSFSHSLVEITAVGEVWLEQ